MTTAVPFPALDPAAIGAGAAADITLQLVLRARTGDRDAVEALLERSVPRLKRWAHGRLPAGARGLLDTADLVQETVIHMLRRLQHFEPRHPGAMQAYLRQAVVNRIRDEVRRMSRHAPPGELPDDLVSAGTSPLEHALAVEAQQRYRAALTRLKERDREIVLARLEHQWSAVEIAERLRFPSIGAARMAITRAIRRLSQAVG